MTKQAEWYQELTREFEKDPKYWVEHLKLAFSEEVGRLMDERNMSQSDLARELGVSRAYITRLFHGTFNPTVETLVKVALALDAKVAVHLHPRQTAACWLDVPVASWSVTIQTDKSVTPPRPWAERKAVTRVEAGSEVNFEPTSAITA